MLNSVTSRPDAPDGRAVSRVAARPRRHAKPPHYAGNERPLHRRAHPNFPVHVIRFIQVVVFSIQYPKIVQLK